MPAMHHVHVLEYETWQSFCFGFFIQVNCGMSYTGFRHTMCCHLV